MHTCLKLFIDAQAIIFGQSFLGSLLLLVPLTSIVEKQDVYFVSSCTVARWSQIKYLQNWFDFAAFCLGTLFFERKDRPVGRICTIWQFSRTTSRFLYLHSTEQYQRGQKIKNRIYDNATDNTLYLTHNFIYTSKVLLLITHSHKIALVCHIKHTVFSNNAILHNPAIRETTFC